MLIDVAATAVNRADLLQAAGRYPPPAGVSDVLGLEASGTVAALGPNVQSPRPGRRVMALLGGGGYAEKVTVPAAQTMPVPDALTLEEAAAVPEAFLTAWRALTQLAPVVAGEHVLVHAAASGVGTAAVQIARELGADPIGTVRSPSKRSVIEELGGRALVADNGRFAEAVRALTGGHGADAVLDLVGGSYWSETMASLAESGRVALVGLLGGGTVDLDLAAVMRLQARIAGGTLRSRSRSEKAALVSSFSDWGLPRLADGRLRPVVATTLPLASAVEAHELIAQNAQPGKVVLTNQIHDGGGAGRPR